MAKTELLYVPQKWISNKMKTRDPGGTIKNPGAVLELPAKHNCQSSPFTSKLGKIGQIGQ